MCDYSRFYFVKALEGSTLLYHFTVSTALLGLLLRDISRYTYIPLPGFGFLLWFAVFCVRAVLTVECCFFMEHFVLCWVSFLRSPLPFRRCSKQPWFASVLGVYFPFGLSLPDLGLLLALSYDGFARFHRRTYSLVTGYLVWCRLLLSRLLASF